MRIRAHHLLCIRNFQGKGYNKEFVENLYNTINKLDDERIKIITSVDIICDKCPFNKEGICKRKKDSEKKSKKLDISVINKAGIKTSRLYAYQELQKLTENLHTKNICNDCEWKRYCE